MSPRAAWRFESLGFTEVYDYVAGEADWFAYGLPMEGTGKALPRVGDVAQRDVPQCARTEQIGGVRARVAAAGWDVCAVVNEASVLLGSLRAQELNANPDAMVEDIMRAGPATYRPDALVSAVLERLLQRGTGGVFVTRSDGTLYGWLRRDDAKRTIDDVNPTATDTAPLEADENR